MKNFCPFYRKYSLKNWNSRFFYEYGYDKKKNSLLSHFNYLF
jgi:hypothetical protein